MILGVDTGCFDDSPAAILCHEFAPESQCPSGLAQDGKVDMRCLFVTEESTMLIRYSSLRQATA